MTSARPHDLSRKGILITAEGVPRYLLTWRLTEEAQTPTVAEVYTTLATPLTGLLAVYIDDESGRGWLMRLGFTSARHGIESSEEPALRTFLERQEPRISFTWDSGDSWTFE
jgi:hypothetical protein